MVMIHTILITILLGVVCHPQPVSAVSAHRSKEQDIIKKLIDDFTSNDWQKVHLAESALESRQAEAIPPLIELLDRDEKVELHNTADLIYPGAKEFYGHGWILDYDVDWISVRAGWALENLTFQNFGFREGVINEADLLKMVIKRQGNVQLTDPSKTATAKKQIRAQASSRAKTWWQESQNSWNRFAAVLESLRSDDPIRQQWTLNWIRNGKTKCDGLNAAQQINTAHRRSTFDEVEREFCVLSVTSLDLSHALPADLFRRHARSPKGYCLPRLASPLRLVAPSRPKKIGWAASRLLS